MHVLTIGICIKEHILLTYFKTSIWQVTGSSRNVTQKADCKIHLVSKQKNQAPQHWRRWWDFHNWMEKFLDFRVPTAYLEMNHKEEVMSEGGGPEKMFTISIKQNWQQNQPGTYFTVTPFSFSCIVMKHPWHSCLAKSSHKDYFFFQNQIKHFPGQLQGRTAPVEAKGRFGASCEDLQRDGQLPPFK